VPGTNHISPRCCIKCVISLLRPWLLCDCSEPAVSALLTEDLGAPRACAGLSRTAASHLLQSSFRGPLGGRLLKLDYWGGSARLSEGIGERCSNGVSNPSRGMWSAVCTGVDAVLSGSMRTDGDACKLSHLA
jgi:hypothetical protein